jgi:hypothetical protein
MGPTGRSSEDDPASTACYEYYWISGWGEVSSRLTSVGLPIGACHLDVSHLSAGQQVGGLLGSKRSRGGTRG